MSKPTHLKAYEIAQLTTLRDAWRKRRAILAPCEDGAPRAEEARRLVLAKCRLDPVFFLAALAWTYDPRLSSEGVRTWVPFVLYPQQVELVRWLDERRRTRTHGAILKPRGVGASWVCQGYATWLWCTKPASKVTWGSRTERDVDRIGNPDSLFEKAAQLIDRMPLWARDALVPGWSMSEHRHHMRIVHPTNGSVISGEIGKNMGRGGRSGLYLWDEAAHHDQPVLVDRAVRENTACQIDLSTPNGTDNPYAQKVTKRLVNVFELSWDDVTWRDEEWLEVKRHEYAHDLAGFEQEIMRSFNAASGDRVLSPEWVRAACVCVAPPKAADEVVAGLDVATSSDRSVLVIRKGARVLHVESYPGAPGEDTGRWALDLCQAFGASVLAYDAIGVGEGVGVYLRTAPEARGLRLLPVVVSRSATETWWPGARATARELFSNLRTELWWTLRERFRRAAGDALASQGEAIDLRAAPEELVEELGWIKRAGRTGGKISLERKDEAKKRMGRSPDHADALLMAYSTDVLTTPAAGWGVPELHRGAA